MLSPAVRAAAAQFATDLNYPAGSPEWAAVTGGWLQGYCRGYRAQGERRQFPLAGQRELLRTLGPYVAEGIDIYHPATGQYGRLLGLPAVYGQQPYPVADVEMYVSAEGQAEGCGNLIEYSPDTILPVLYAPADLGELLPTLPAWLQEQLGPLTAPFAAHESLERALGWIESWAKRIDALRAAGFAVGLAPDHYHRKQVAALGPELLTFGEPLPSVTPCPSGRNDRPSGCPKCPAEMEVARA